MNKNDFLNSLKEELEKNGHSNTQDVIDYYEELISDKKELEIAELDIIKELGPIKNIVNTIKIEHQLETLEKKPTLSNSLKVLVTFLGILSLPMLLPIIIVVIALSITLLALIITALATMLAALVTLIVAIPSLFFALFVSKLSLGVFIFMLGFDLIITVLFIIFSFNIFKSIKAFTKYLINFPKKLINKKERNLKHE